MSNKPTKQQLATLRGHLADLTEAQLCEVYGIDRDELIERILLKAAESDKWFSGAMKETLDFVGD